MTRMAGSATRFDMTTKLRAKRRQELFRERVILTRSEAHVERRRQHVGGHVLFDGCGDGPASFTRVLHTADEAVEARIAIERDGGEIEQPGADDAATAPDLGDLAEVEGVA